MRNRVPGGVTRSRGEIRPGLVMLALATGGFAIGTAEFATMSLLPYLAAGLRIDAPTAGHVISAYALGVVTGAPVIAVVASRVSRRKLLIVLMGQFALANALSALAPSYGWMLFFRFLSGVPHGAYFGVAALVAAGLVPPNRRAWAVARVMTGLTVATVVGVPVANALGQAIGWRWSFAVVTALAIVTILLVWRFAPHDARPSEASPLRELTALGRLQVWLTLATGAIGFGGLFAVYTYLASTLIEVTHAPPALIPPVFAMFGSGMVVGSLGAAWAADRALLRTAIGLLLWSAAALALFPAMAHHLWSLAASAFLIGLGGGIGPVLQTRLMDVAGDAQTLAAALHHSAFNVANALGPWLGGLVIAAGYGWTATGWVGSLLALGGLAILAVSIVTERQRPPG